MMTARAKALAGILAALTLGWATDILLRQSITGLNFLIFTVLWVSVCWVVGKAKRPFRPILIYSSFAVINALIVYARASVLVQFWSIIISLVSLMLLAGSFSTENWVNATLTGRLRSIITHFTQTARGLPREYQKYLKLEPTNKQSRGWGKGIVVAAVLGIIFIALFASADQVMAHSFTWLSDVAQSISTFLGRYDVGRFMSVLFWSAFALVVIRSLTVRQLARANSPQIKRVLHPTDAHIIIWTLTAIFTLFVALQVRYLFAGAELPAGLTYADYARRGYGQLLVATLLASAVAKGTITSLKAEASPFTRTATTLLLMLNGIVVIAAWKRLSLYETAYGWTLTRFVARLGLICILLGTVGLVIWLWRLVSSRQLYAYCWYVLAVVLTVAAIANPESIIAQKNIQERPDRSVALDTQYMSSLSPDSWPAVCAYAPQLKLHHATEYQALTQNFAQTAPAHNQGLSRHATNNASYQTHYKNCLN